MHLKYTCLNVAEDGHSYFEESLVEVSSDHPLGLTSNPLAVKSLTFRKSLPGTFEWHPAPQKQFIVYLKGEVEIEAGSGETKIFRPGDILLVKDTSGKGHRTTTLTEGEALILPLA